MEESELQKILANYVPRRYLTQREAVIYTGTSPGTLNKWKKQGLRIVILSEDGRPKYDTKDLDDWMEKFKTKEVKL